VDTVEDTTHLPVILAVTALPLQATMAVADTARRAATLVVATARLPATSAVTALPLPATMAVGDTARRAATLVVVIARLPAALAATALPLHGTMAVGDTVRRAGTLVVAIARLPVALAATPVPPEAVHQAAGAEVMGVALQAIPTVVRARDAEIGEQRSVPGKAPSPGRREKFLSWVGRGTEGH
jgi:hypothetical protein